MNYYNEHDPKAAAWLRELIKQGHIPDGFVDTRSIVDVRGSDLAGYTQCHFFAGIGGWPRALQLAGWPADRPVWTGSCPCQPFSCAGKGKGADDERHLWPEFARIIGECRPATVFGEQVASKAGREWLSGVFADLEGMGYAAAGADLCAAGVGAPHIRQRLFWVANARHGKQGSAGRGRDEPAGLAAPGVAGAGSMGHTESDHEQWERQSGEARCVTDRGSGFWSDWQPLHFRDGKTRRTKPGLFCLAHGVSARVVRLRGAGNAIVPQVAAQFICAADAPGLMTEAELEAFTWDFPAEWPEYERIEAAYNALCDAGKLINTPLD